MAANQNLASGTGHATHSQSFVPSSTSQLRQFLEGQEFSGKENFSPELGEVYFLVMHFLGGSPCEKASGQLWNELLKHKLLPRRYHGFYSRTGNPSQVEEDDGISCPLNYGELAGRHPHIPKSYLVDLLHELLRYRRLEAMRDEEERARHLGDVLSSLPSDRATTRKVSAADAPTLLGKGAFSLLHRVEGVQDEESPEFRRLRQQLRWPHEKADQIHGLLLREIGGGFPRGPNRLPSYSSFGRTFLKPQLLFDRLKHIKTLRGHRNAVYCAVFDQTGRYFITGSDDRLVKLWSTETGLCLRSCRGHTGDITDLAVSSDNLFFASASNDTTIRVWKLPHAIPHVVLVGHEEAVTAIAFNPGRGDEHLLLSSSEDGSCRMWDVDNLNVSRVFIPSLSDSVQLPGQPETFPKPAPILCCTFNADGSLFATGSADAMARLWDTRKRVGEQNLEGHKTDVNYVQFSGCSPLARPYVQLDFDDGERRFEASPQDRLVTCSRDGCLIIWRRARKKTNARSYLWSKAIYINSQMIPPSTNLPRPGAVRRNLNIPMAVNTSVWSLDKKYVLAAMSDCRICVWKGDGYQPILMHSLWGHEKQVYVLDVHPRDPRIAMSAGYDGLVIIWNIWEGEPVKVFNGITDYELVDGHFSPDGTALVVSDEVGQLYYFSMESGERWEGALFDQFFLGDYRPIIHDIHHNVVDQETQLPPEERNLSDLLCDASLIPYPEPVQRQYQIPRMSALGRQQWEPLSRRLEWGLSESPGVQVPTPRGGILPQERETGQGLRTTRSPEGVQSANAGRNGVAQERRARMMGGGYQVIPRISNGISDRGLNLGETEAGQRFENSEDGRSHAVGEQIGDSPASSEYSATDVESDDEESSTPEVTEQVTRSRRRKQDYFDDLCSRQEEEEGTGESDGIEGREETRRVSRRVQALEEKPNTRPIRLRKRRRFWSSECDSEGDAKEDTKGKSRASTRHGLGPRGRKVNDNRNKRPRRQAATKALEWMRFREEEAATLEASLRHTVRESEALVRESEALVREGGRAVGRNEYDMEIEAGVVGHRRRGRPPGNRRRGILRLEDSEERMEMEREGLPEVVQRHGGGNAGGSGEEDKKEIEDETSPLRAPQEREEQRRRVIGLVSGQRNDVIQQEHCTSEPEMQMEEEKKPSHRLRKINKKVKKRSGKQVHLQDEVEVNDFDEGQSSDSREMFHEAMMDKEERQIGEPTFLPTQQGEILREDSRLPNCKVEEPKWNPQASTSKNHLDEGKPFEGDKQILNQEPSKGKLKGEVNEPRKRLIVKLSMANTREWKNGKLKVRSASLNNGLVEQKRQKKGVEREDKEEPGCCPGEESMLEMGKPGDDVEGQTKVDGFVDRERRNKKRMETSNELLVPNMEGSYNCNERSGPTEDENTREERNGNNNDKVNMNNGQRDTVVLSDMMIQMSERKNGKSNEGFINTESNVDGIAGFNSRGNKQKNVLRSYTGGNRTKEHVGGVIDCSQREEIEDKLEVDKQREGLHSQFVMKLQKENGDSLIHKDLTTACFQQEKECMLENEGRGKRPRVEQLESNDMETGYETSSCSIGEREKGRGKEQTGKSTGTPYNRCMLSHDVDMEEKESFIPQDKEGIGLLKQKEVSQICQEGEREEGTTPQIRVDGIQTSNSSDEKRNVKRILHSFSDTDEKVTEKEGETLVREDRSNVVGALCDMICSDMQIEESEFGRGQEIESRVYDNDESIESQVGRRMSSKKVMTRGVHKDIIERDCDEEKPRGLRERWHHVGKAEEGGIGQLEGRLENGCGVRDTEAQNEGKTGWGKKRGRGVSRRVKEQEDGGTFGGHLYAEEEQSVPKKCGNHLSPPTVRSPCETLEAKSDGRSEFESHLRGLEEEVGRGRRHCTLNLEAIRSQKMTQDQNGIDDSKKHFFGSKEREIRGKFDSPWSLQGSHGENRESEGSMSRESSPRKQSLTEKRTRSERFQTIDDGQVEIKRQPQQRSGVRRTRARVNGTGKKPLMEEERIIRTVRGKRNRFEYEEEEEEESGLYEKRTVKRQRVASLYEGSEVLWTPNSRKSNNQQKPSAGKGGGSGERASRKQTKGLTRAIKNGEWLMSTEREEGQYVPQLGDSVVYIRRGHEEYLRKLRKENASDEERSVTPWSDLDSIRPVENCQVVGLDYIILQGRKSETGCKLELKITDPMSLNHGEVFRLILADISGSPDFLILRGRYNFALERKWSVQDPCEVWWAGKGGDPGQFWTGIVKYVRGRTSRSSETLWESLIVVYDSFKDESKHSPWELLDPDPPRRWQPPSLDDDIREKVLQNLNDIQEGLRQGEEDEYSLTWFEKPWESSNYLQRYYRSQEALTHHVRLLEKNAETLFGDDVDVINKARRLVEDSLRGL